MQLRACVGPLLPVDDAITGLVVNEVEASATQAILGEARVRLGLPPVAAGDSAAAGY